MATDSAVAETLRQIFKTEKTKAMSRGDYASAIVASIFEDAINE